MQGCSVAISWDMLEVNEFVYMSLLRSFGGRFWHIFYEYFIPDGIFAKRDRTNGLDARAEANGMQLVYSEFDNSNG
jgi:hypothetical protein